MRERFVGVEHAVAAGEKIPFEPALALVLAEHFHHPSVAGEPFVAAHNRRLPLAVGRLEHRVEPIRDGFVRAEQAEVAAIVVGRNHVAQKRAEDTRVLGVGAPRRSTATR